jgi:glucoamylase
MFEELERLAPGAPGLPPRWTSSAKAGVGTALTSASRLWFTISHGIVNEIYYPRLDEACTRDLGLIVTDGAAYFSEEKRHATHVVDTLAEGVPAFELVNTATDGRYRIIKRVITDPRRDVLLQHIRFEPLHGALGDYRLFALLAPHLANAGANNTAWLDSYKGVPMLFAEGRGTFLALASSTGWAAASAGFVGVSDGWQSLSRTGTLSEKYARAEGGNVGLTGELRLDAAGETLLALGFGRRPEEAALRARSSLQEGFDIACRDYVAGWRATLGEVRPLSESIRADHDEFYRTSVSVMLTHEPLSFAGGIIASLSIPWGSSKGDDDLGGYHLVWPRDLVETAGGLSAAGLGDAARAVLVYLAAVQEPDGRWPQNMWLDGRPYWTGVQLDECAFPILLVELLRREGQLHPGDLERFEDMIERAAAFVVRTGPATNQDRWEEDAGYSPFSLGVVVAALFAAADLLALARGMSDPAVTFLRETADCWNGRIEEWCYATGTPLAKEAGVEGYYVRIAPLESEDGVRPIDGTVTIKNRALEASTRKASEVVSLDALALVRFGLRAADDPRILNTVRVVDRLTRVELPQGPVWHRYNEDGYGEHADGRPFDGVGIGRLWPLLTGERAHYELAAGRPDEALRLLKTMEACASRGRLLPEQVWDADDIPERELFRGKPTGSAMPLVWAHSEHVKLLRSLEDGQVFDMPAAAAARLRAAPSGHAFAAWRLDRRLRTLARGEALRIEVLAPALVHWSTDGWTKVKDTPTLDSGLGLFYLDLDVKALEIGSTVIFTLFWPSENRWQGDNFTVTIR